MAPQPAPGTADPAPASSALSGPAFNRRLYETFVQAFQTQQELKLMLRLETGKSLETIAGAGPLNQVISQLLFEQGDDPTWIPTLVQGACRHFPNSRALWQLARELNCAPPVSPAPAAPGLEALGVLLENPANRRLAAPHRAALQTASSRAHRVSGFKSLHDLLDQFRRRVYTPLQFVVRRFPGGDSIVEVNRYATEFRTLQRRFVEISRLPCFSSGEFPWIEEDFMIALDAITLAQRTREVAPLQTALDQIAQVVEGELAGLDSRLTQAAGDLDLAGLTAHLRQLCADLQQRGADAYALRQIDSDVATLDQIATALSRLVAEHNAWQTVDNRLNRFERALGQPIESLNTIWRLLERRFQALCPPTSTGTCAEIGQSAAGVATALQARDQSAVLEQFSTLSTLARDYFFGIDRSLMNECERVRGIGRGLDLILEKLDG
jgi:hypothetical protein